MTGAPGSPSWPGPIGVGSVLDATFALYRRQALAFMLAVAIVVVPLALADHLLKVSLGMAPDAPMRATDSSQTPDGVGDVLYVFLSLVVLLTGDTLSAGAVVVLASQAILGHPVDVWAAYRLLLRRAGTVVTATALAMVVWLALAVTCIGLPFAMRFALRWSLVVPVVLLEGGGTMDGLRRSRELTSGHLWRLLGIILSILLLDTVLISAPYYGAWYLLAWLVDLAGGGDSLDPAAEALMVLVNAAMRVVFGSLASIATVVAYYSVRVHDEGLDLQHRAAALGDESA